SFSSSLTASAPTALYTLSLHDALPISAAATDAPSASSRRGSRAASTAPRRRIAPSAPTACVAGAASAASTASTRSAASAGRTWRSEEHTSELQSRGHLVCRLLLEKKKE